MTNVETTETPRDRIARVAGELGLTMVSDFVPWSQSRNAGEKNPSLNWNVTIKRGVAGAGDSKTDVAILTTDYSAGCAHCPSYKQGDRSQHGYDVLVWECQNGLPRHAPYSSNPIVPKNNKPIRPDMCDVVHSLVMDSYVLDHATFESWASDFGYDADSRKAETIYRACLEIALKLRNGIGESGLARLREACQDY
jgi:hypothetical protein